MPDKRKARKMVHQYTLKIQNDSAMTSCFYLYQKMVGQNATDYVPFAWFAKVSHPGTQIIFRWQEVFNFAWCDLKSLEPGSQYNAWAVQIANPMDDTQNSVGFSKQDGAFMFTAAKQSVSADMLQIEADATIPVHQAAVGLGMDGQPTLVTMAMPNYSYNFTAKVEYWIGYGNYSQGTIVRPKDTDFQIIIPLNMDTVLVTLHQNNDWSLVALKKMETD